MSLFMSAIHLGRFLIQPFLRVQGVIHIFKVTKLSEVNVMCNFPTAEYENRWILQVFIICFAFVTKIKTKKNVMWNSCYEETWVLNYA